MKTVLVILTQSNWLHQNCNESIALAMLLATFGYNVKVLLKDEALSLLTRSDSNRTLDQSSATLAITGFNADFHPFKPANLLVDSFDFYDLTPILIDEQHKNNHWVCQSAHELEFIQFDAKFLAQFEHILYC